MADPLTINIQDAPAAAPAVYTVPGSAEVEPLSAFATFDGTGAASSFLPSIAFYSASGLLVARAFPDGQTVAAGGSADVSYFPGVAGASSSGGGITSWAQLNSLGAQTFNNAAQTIAAPLNSQQVHGTAFGADTTNGRITLLETGFFIASCLVDFGGYFSPMTLALTAFAGDGSIFPYENTVTAVTQGFHPNPTAMGAAGSFFLSTTIFFVVTALGSTAGSSFIDVRVVNDSGANRSASSTVLVAAKLGDIP